MPQSMQTCSFALMLPVFHLFDYEIDEATRCKPGQRFTLPFGSGEKVGLLLDCQTQNKQNRKLKPVNIQLDSEPLLSSHLMQLAEWMADYYCQPLGELIFQFLPKYARRKQILKAVAIEYWKANEVEPQLMDSLKKKAPRQFQILRALQHAPEGLNAVDLKSLSSGWRAQLRNLLDKELVHSYLREPLLCQQVQQQQKLQLTAEQQQVSDDILQHIDSFSVQLIQGVTGSGKTEVYLTMMEQVIEQGGQVIYLVPEIGLTPQLLERLQSRLGQVVVSSHSAQADYARYQSWDQFRRGVGKVMIGTRSALFSDAPGLALIIIDEEHDASYRQQDGVRYHARDVAIKRAQMLDIPVLLGSATPSLETLHNLHKRHYYHHFLHQRPNNAQPPEMKLIDSGRVNLNSGCTPQLLAAIQHHLDQGGQVLLFLNRRGFAPVVMCHECGWQSGCHQCDARMTLHQSINRMVCHHCGYSEPLKHECPSCGEQEIRHYGVGTEQLQEFVQQRFSDVPVIRIDRDSVSNAQQMDRLLSPVHEGRPCILLGTQMLAKGHDYPNITLVGILDTDQALYSSFYRASERLIQTVLQVSGRAGRAEKPGQALLQTAFPDHPLMKDLLHKGYSELVEPILQERQLVGFPPFVRVITLSADALDLPTAMNRLQQIHHQLMQLDGVSKIKVVSPIPALMTRRVGRYRAQMSMMANDIQNLRRILKQLLPEIYRVKNTQKLRVVIEVDPLDL